MLDTLPLGRTLAEASRLAYLDSTPELRAELFKLGMRLHARFPADNPRHYVAELLHRGRCYAVVVFRGTTLNWRDIRDDLDAEPFWPTRDDWDHRNMVDRGFWDALDPDWDWLVRVLTGLDREIIFGGHSLGGAMATIAAGRALGARLRVGGLVTFGSPRAAGRGLGRLLARVPVDRYVHCCDVVPTQPPPLGYRHLGALRYIDRHGELWHESSMLHRAVDRLAAYLRAAEDLAKAPDRLGRWEARGLADHRIAGYCGGFKTRKTPALVTPGLRRSAV